MFGARTRRRVAELEKRCEELETLWESTVQGKLAHEIKRAAKSAIRETSTQR